MPIYGEEFKVANLGGGTGKPLPRLVKDLKVAKGYYEGWYVGTEENTLTVPNVLGRDYYLFPYGNRVQFFVFGKNQTPASEPFVDGDFNILYFDSSTLKIKRYFNDSSKNTTYKMTNTGFGYNEFGCFEITPAWKSFDLWKKKKLILEQKDKEGKNHYFFGNTYFLDKKASHHGGEPILGFINWTEKAEQPVLAKKCRKSENKIIFTMTFPKEILMVKNYPITYNKDDLLKKDCFYLPMADFLTNDYEFSFDKSLIKNYTEQMTEEEIVNAFNGQMGALTFSYFYSKFITEVREKEARVPESSTGTAPFESFFAEQKTEINIVPDTIGEQPWYFIIRAKASKKGITVSHKRTEGKPVKRQISLYNSSKSGHINSPEQKDDTITKIVYTDEPIQSKTKGGTISEGFQFTHGSVDGVPLIWEMREHTGRSNTGEDYNCQYYAVLSKESVDMIGPRIYDYREPNSSVAEIKTGGNNDYPLTNVHQWLNSEGTYDNWFSPTHPIDTNPNENDQDGFLHEWTIGELELTPEVEWQSRISNPNGGGKKSYKSRISLMSQYQAGFSNDASGGYPIKYFSSDANRNCGVIWALNSCNPSTQSQCKYITVSGTIANDNCYNGFCVRPIFNPSLIIEKIDIENHCTIDEEIVFHFPLNSEEINVELRQFAFNEEGECQNTVSMEKAKFNLNAYPKSETFFTSQSSDPSEGYSGTLQLIVDDARYPAKKAEVYGKTKYVFPVEADRKIYIDMPPQMQGNIYTKIFDYCILDEKGRITERGEIRF